MKSEGCIVQVDPESSPSNGYYYELEDPEYGAFEDIKEIDLKCSNGHLLVDLGPKVDANIFEECSGKYNTSKFVNTSNFYNDCKL